MKRLASVLLVLLIVLAGLWMLRGTRGVSRGTRAIEIVATLRSEPRSLNRLLAGDRASLVVSQLIHEPLVRVNHLTQAIEPALASSWTTLDDGRRVRLVLRTGVRFSDGSAITADDVVFSLAAVYDPRLASPLVDSLTVNGAPITAHAIDAHTVELRYPAPYGPGVRPLHGLPILPRPRYARLVADGTLAEAWTPTATPAGMVGAGPFVLERHEPGIAVHLARNPHYWRMSEDGTRLPRADRLRLDIVPSQDAEMLRLRGGDVDLITAELRADDLPEARALAADGRLQLFELGPSLDADMLWFNLRPPSPGGERSSEDRRAWLRRRELREAISHAVDRGSFINAVYRGAGVQVSGMITPGNHAWHAADISPRPFSLAMAGEQLDRIGVRDRNGDGVREDVYNTPATFTLLVQQGHTARQRAAVVLQEALARIGLKVEIASLDARGLQERMANGTYDAIYHALPGSDTDPSGLMEFWLSSGRFHLWNPAQAAPGTKWEQELDLLMTRQLSMIDASERQRTVMLAQKVLDQELPVIVFAVPRVTIATSARLTHVAPGLLAPQVLWNAAEIGVR
ncbi:putative ABC transporter-binding protein precursor [Luteitalea pratensis]|uniref:Putative ABC transporter-binding protein n=1 Tax=Luteitalea pratensis TaxID=1855912 RepID=A0A143PYC3_LUTPR|nr:ABC transporter substrate-binding protein [Luteitalea pratensis]AMY12799.1 putative ABC transporter-binding protein precursor [Luteitalea pratensis]